MKNITPISDVYLIKEILEPVYDELVYDGSPTLNNFVPRGLWFILLDNYNVAGLINLEALNNVLWIPHIFIYEEYRGKDSTKWGHLVIKSMKEKYGEVKFLAFTPYKQAKKYAEKLGFKYVSTLTESIKKNGKLLDQYVLERSC